MYDIYSAPVQNLGNQTFLVTVGNVVGGGSYVNGMQFDRGADADYDAWAELGNKGWGWSGLRPYFMKSNSFDPPSEKTAKQFGITYEKSAYGKGPLKVSIPDCACHFIPTTRPTLTFDYRPVPRYEYHFPLLGCS